MSEWQMVETDTGSGVTDRMAVPGGWVYRSIVISDNNMSMSSVFVPFTERWFETDKNEWLRARGTKK